MIKSKVAFGLLALVACAPSAPTSSPSASEGKVTEPVAVAPASQPAPTSQPSAPSAGERTFGAALKSPGDPINVAEVLRDPQPFVGKTIKAEGMVARVCEKAGCWLELKPEVGEGGLRVPMAQHAFFIPQDAVGHRAIVEGELQQAALSPSHKEHLESEGAKAVGPLSLAATGVLVR